MNRVANKNRMIAIAQQRNTMIMLGNAADIAGLVATAMQVVKKS